MDALSASRKRSAALSMIRIMCGIRGATGSALAAKKKAAAMDAAAFQLKVRT
jgi:hypothetical protein